MSPLLFSTTMLLGQTSRPASFLMVNDVLALYHQQTTNILCSYSPQKLGFF